MSPTVLRMAGNKLREARRRVPCARQPHPAAKARYSGTSQTVIRVSRIDRRSSGLTGTLVLRPPQSVMTRLSIAARHAAESGWSESPNDSRRTSTKPSRLPTLLGAPSGPAGAGPPIRRGQAASDLRWARDSGDAPPIREGRSPCALVTPSIPSLRPSSRSIRPWKSLRSRARPPSPRGGRRTSRRPHHRQLAVGKGVVSCLYRRGGFRGRLFDSRR